MIDNFFRYFYRPPTFAFPKCIEIVHSGVLLMALPVDLHVGVSARELAHPGALLGQLGLHPRRQARLPRFRRARRLAAHQRHLPHLRLLAQPRLHLLDLTRDGRRIRPAQLAAFHVAVTHHLHLHVPTPGRNLLQTDQVPLLVRLHQHRVVRVLARQVFGRLRRHRILALLHDHPMLVAVLAAPSNGRPRVTGLRLRLQPVLQMLQQVPHFHRQLRTRNRPLVSHARHVSRVPIQWARYPTARLQILHRQRAALHRRATHLVVLAIADRQGRQTMR
ncbi:hypothetical protein WK65_07130 [Burkholderia ubonensis]|nr:hypothetical protein WK65_07130 [Burkholderia ubonensis]